MYMNRYKYRQKEQQTHRKPSNINDQSHTDRSDRRRQAYSWQTTEKSPQLLQLTPFNSVVGGISAARVSWNRPIKVGREKSAVVGRLLSFVCTGLNKLHSVKPTLDYLSLSHLSRRDAVTLRRLRIGHTQFSHSYLLNREDQPRCTFCDCALTVVHMLLECPHYSIWNGQNQHYSGFY